MTVLVMCGLSAALGVAATWSIQTLLDDGSDDPSISNYAVATAKTGAVHESLALNVVASWRSKPEGLNRAQGIVTQVFVSSRSLTDIGKKLYSVDERPVFAAVGTTPSYRDMRPGSRGEDVRQLQQLMAHLGYYGGPLDGVFGAQLLAAVRSWQTELGLASTGAVTAGDILFFSQLPARIAPNPKVLAPGLTLTGGESAVRALAEVPDFSLPVTEAQAAAIPRGTHVRIATGDGVWRAVTASTTRTGDGSARITLKPASGTSICGSACSTLGADTESLLNAKVLTVPKVRGTVIPAAAVTSGPSGDLNVVDANGLTHRVEVLGVATGMAVVRGVEPGTSVRLSSEAEETS